LFVTFARCFVAFVVLASFISHASADDRARARSAFRAGSQHYNLGEFQQALDSFKEAYRNYEDPSFLYNIAQCERQLGHKREAVREYRAYLNNSESADNRDSVRQIIGQLEREIAADDQRAAAAAAAQAAKPTPTSTTGTLTTTSSAATTAAEPSTATLTASAPPPAERKPAYKKWWVWTIVGGVVAAGAATGVALALTRPSSPTAPTSLGTSHPAFGAQ
jgi:tetratricopeptide (TPR) repeat protein